MPPTGGIGIGHRPPDDDPERPRLDPRGRALPRDARASRGRSRRRSSRGRVGAAPTRAARACGRGQRAASAARRGRAAGRRARAARRATYVEPARRADARSRPLHRPPVVRASSFGGADDRWPPVSCRIGRCVRSAPSRANGQQRAAVHGLSRRSRPWRSRIVGARSMLADELARRRVPGGMPGPRISSGTCVDGVVGEVLALGDAVLALQVAVVGGEEDVGLVELARCARSAPTIAATASSTASSDSRRAAWRRADRAMSPPVQRVRVPADEGAACRDMSASSKLAARGSGSAREAPGGGAARGARAAASVRWTSRDLVVRRQEAQRQEERLAAPALARR